MTNEFGRRRAAAKAEAAAGPRVAAKGASDEAEGGAADTLFSWLFGPLGGVIVGILVVCLLVSLYVSGMKGMGRALDDSWSRNATVVPVEEKKIDFGGSPCDRQMINATAEFRKVLRDLCDAQK